jgi:hypothetical protein
LYGALQISHLQSLSLGHRPEELHEFTDRLSLLLYR